MEVGVICIEQTFSNFKKLVSNSINLGKSYSQTMLVAGHDIYYNLGVNTLRKYFELEPNTIKVELPSKMTEQCHKKYLLGYQASFIKNKHGREAFYFFLIW